MRREVLKPRDSQADLRNYQETYENSGMSLADFWGDRRVKRRFFLRRGISN
jgi:hypothetical protein